MFSTKYRVIANRARAASLQREKSSNGYNTRVYKNTKGEYVIFWSPVFFNQTTMVAA